MCVCKGEIVRRESIVMVWMMGGREFCPHSPRKQKEKEERDKNAGIHFVSMVDPTRN